MKNKLVVLLIVVMVFCTVFVGCATQDKIDDALATENIQNKDNTENTENRENTEQKQEETSNASDTLKERSKKEGVSANEMEQMIKELTKITAERYGDTYDNYVATLESEGKTPFDEFSTAADYMGITIKEYYEHEKNKPELSEEDKEIMQGMNDAMKEIEGIDLSALEEQTNQLEENAKAMENAGSVETNGDVLELIKYEVLEVANEENEAGIGYYGIEYTSKKEVSDVFSHFNNFLKGTENYFIMDSSPAAAIVSGTVNNNTLDMSCERDFDNGITYITVMYNGEIEKK